ncbi:MAG: precorrin-6y C5,15-methyltransferase (decarboxylating) subunit CbiE [Telmatospirillum sp.]|nr:precorrin-6y C5,15-methyltransferase (decarboxylating) subunit CbiE [Telmatospirillum sp.]
MTETAPWLFVIGIGEDGIAGLSPAARAILAASDVVVGGERHLAMLDDLPAERIVWTAPFSANRDRLAGNRGRRVVVLASGDPMWFGIGSVLIRWFGATEVRVVTHPGSFSLAAAAMGWAVQDCRCLTIHGRPAAALSLHLFPGARLLVLSENASSPAEVADLLSAQGFGGSHVTVLEHLGGTAERRFDGAAAGWPHPAGADLNVLAIEVIANPGWSRRPAVPGLPDEAFDHDGQITKREIRAVTLSALAPWPGALLWDIGAGSGSIAIEWMRAGGRACALEQDSARCARIGVNALTLGVPGLEIIEGRAPDALASLPPRPDSVFVGGGVTSPQVLDLCWRALSPGGRLVANAVTAEAEAALLAWQARQGGDLVRIAVSRLGPTGRFQCWHPLMPITQYIGCKS